ncbi:MAG: Trigger factor [Candidatus Magasanikbacteria bacterium GW2011_GWA2_46_17]|uniref:Trigger factor n=1 Tax=Candidatus Magasanikbacteria bacterium GW2011_GWA2_46_17 TaxID=1619042 RepID=A0A0G1NZ77_9BACT|nr:MAG: Trigger factor [Candidatus Magasanikbacteria bacterium GW2011_GWA2_46_17]
MKTVRFSFISSSHQLDTSWALPRGSSFSVMKYEKKDIAKSQVEFTITVEAKDYEKEMQAAAVRLSERAAIKGFRPGKAPYDMVKQQMGELKILEEAMQDIVEKNYYQAVTAEKLRTVGTPQITIVKVAPGNEFVFKAMVALLPLVKVGDISKLDVKREPKEVSDKDVDTIIGDLRKMQTKEMVKNGSAGKEDKVVIDMDMLLDKVPVEGGQAKDHQVYLNEPYYIPGLTEQIIGLKKGDHKEFTLKFPKEHYQKNIAGRDIDFQVNVKEVFELQIPELTDEFAKKLGQESVEKMKELLRKNLTEDTKNKDEQRVEVELLNKLIDISEFGGLPEVLVDSEKHKMFHELKHDLERQGVSMEQYLQDLKKTEQEIQKDFAEGAAKRAKAALLSRQIALDNSLAPSKEEIDAEIELIKKSYPDDKTVAENIKHPEMRDTLVITVQNRKVVAWLKEKVFGKEKK